MDMRYIMLIDTSIGKGRLGILGGMGSEATACFVRTLAQRSPATVDQDHIPFVLLSCPEIPDRSTAIEAGDAGVQTIIRTRLTQLERTGCGAVAIPCNTAHYWRRHFASSLQIPLIDMVSATARHAAHLNARSAIVLGTHATMKLRLYDEALAGFDIQSVDVDDEIIRSTSSAIALAKSADIDESRKQLVHVLDACRSLCPDVIILGCTELPMVLPSEAIAEDLIDSDACLADACIRWWLSAPARNARAKSLSTEELVNER
ncbi:amino acid racemase [Paraburkholderia sp. RAU2J]|uniref:aspartate/glutamate racemase family protein n=1 Tax=Paraburkholderia sp. RAU2J TaxID=1938810 RepID=UPI001315957E|nr:amino acid racemase [Paraburkholderia sp. RAU2J]